MLISINGIILKFMSCIFASPWRLKIRVFLPQLGHQPVYLIPIKAGDLPDLFIAQARLTPTATLHQNAQHSSFGGLPINASACFTLTAFSQAVVQVRVDTPVGSPPLAAVFDVTCRLHTREPLADLGFTPLAKSRGCAGVYLRVLKQVLQQQQFVHTQVAFVPTLLGYEQAKSSISSPFWESPPKRIRRFRGCEAAPCLQ